MGGNKLRCLLGLHLVMNYKNRDKTCCVFTISGCISWRSVCKYPIYAAGVAGNTQFARANQGLYILKSETAVNLSPNWI